MSPQSDHNAQPPRTCPACGAPLLVTSVDDAWPPSLDACLPPALLQLRCATRHRYAWIEGDIALRPVSAPAFPVAAAT